MTIPSSSDIKAVDIRKDIRLLVIDDSDEHYEHMSEVATMYNPEFSVELQRAESREAVSELSESWEPTVALVDVHILSDALNLITQLSHQGVPVVATSTVRLPELAETAQQYGAVAYFNKSENPEEIEAMLEYIATVSAPPKKKH